MKPEWLDLASLDRQFEQLRAEARSRYELLAAEFQPDRALDKKLRNLRAERDLEALRNTGLDLDALEAQLKEERELLRQDFEQFTQAPPPQGLGEHRNRDLALRRGVAQLTSTGTWLFGPAYACELCGDESDAACTAELAEVDMKFFSTGLGGSLGWFAFGYPQPKCARLWFVYWPSANGNLFVTPFVEAQGTVYVSANDHWYSSTEAVLRMTTRSSLYQSYWDIGNELVIVNQDVTDSSRSYWVDRAYIPEVSTTVVAGQPVWILVEINLWGYGRSDDAIAAADFFTGADKFIRVPLVIVELDIF